VVPAAALGSGLDAPVPSCPGWAMRDLLAHIGFVHRWVAGYVQNGRTEMVDEPDEAGVLAAAPPDYELLPWVAEGHASPVSALLSAPADLRCWTFLSAPSPLAFRARRQAHETATTGLTPKGPPPRHRATSKRLLPRMGSTSYCSVSLLARVRDVTRGPVPERSRSKPSTPARRRPGRFAERLAGTVPRYMVLSVT
jgi:Mycothiol maleylpyruvate isomerase N-terminal domain